MDAHAAAGCTVHALPAEPGTARRWAAAVAALTRAAHAGPPPLAGLPPQDAASERAAVLAREIEAGARLWVALAGGEVPVAALRVTDGGQRGWQVRRVSVLPAWRGRGLARLLLEAVEVAAARAGAARIWLDAVVERCLPPVYARLGFRGARRWPSTDKPLTELTMQRRPGDPRRAHALPWEGDEAAAPGGVMLTWFVTPGGLLAVAGLAADPRAGLAEHAARAAAAGAQPLRLGGADLWPQAGRGELARLGDLLGRVAVPRSGVWHAGGPRGAIPAHLMPRTLEPSLLALWRFAEGREPALTPDGRLSTAAPPAIPASTRHGAVAPPALPAARPA